jgi:hypothetical protein
LAESGKDACSGARWDRAESEGRKRQRIACGCGSSANKPASYAWAYAGIFRVLHGYAATGGKPLHVGVESGLWISLCGEISRCISDPSEDAERKRQGIFSDSQSLPGPTDAVLLGGGGLRSSCGQGSDPRVLRGRLRRNWCRGCGRLHPHHLGKRAGCGLGGRYLRWSVRDVVERVRSDWSSLLGERINTPAPLWCTANPLADRLAVRAYLWGVRDVVERVAHGLIFSIPLGEMKCAPEGSLV